MICKKKKSQLLANPLGVPKGVEVLWRRLNMQSDNQISTFFLTAEFEVRNQLNKNKQEIKMNSLPQKNYLLDEAK